MMTIAIMTMAFLPATFFATIFAMPILKWDESQVMMPQMWLYVELVVPITFIIFVVWVYLTYRRKKRVGEEEKIRTKSLIRQLHWRQQHYQSPVAHSAVAKRRKVAQQKYEWNSS